ncbi:MAG: dephospho-CoA kinase [Hyphomicrobium sp.]
MLIIGLTGSLGMGKSTAAEYLRSRGLPVFDADAAVHALYEGAAVPFIEREFPGTTSQGKVDRGKLGAAVTRNPERLAALEAIVHPLVREAESGFLKKEATRGTRMAVLEIPLLFETSADAKVDATIVVSASAELQRQRLMKRPGMSPEKLESLLARQMPDAQKRTRADFVVDTTGEITASRAALDAIIANLEHREGRAFVEFWA